MTKYKFLLLVGVLFCSLMLVLIAPQNVAAASYAVNNIGDGGDVAPGDGVCETGSGNGICTLRAAIEEANASPGPDTITFDLSVGAVAPTSALPALDDTTGGTTIKGNPTWLLGSFAGTGVDGLTLISDNNKIQGLWITNFDDDGLQVLGDDNIIGTDGDGVDDASEGNVISGNGDEGVTIDGASGNWLAGNWIGITTNGDGDYGNAGTGVMLFDGGQANLIGTDGDGLSDELEGNVISGNGANGIFLMGTCTHNVIAGNYIGTDASGYAAIANDDDGIHINQTSTANLIGTDADGVSDELERNVISGNGSHGVYIYKSDNNVVAGNYIGVNAAGEAALPNIATGVTLGHSNNNRVGGTLAAERNVISGNTFEGVRLSTESASQVLGNYIGTDASGNGSLGNGIHGVNISGTSTNNTVGGTSGGAANRIAFNGRVGIRVYDTAYGHTLRSNTIFANSELGIDLTPEYDVTPNDAGDGDEGGNHLQNFPVLTSAESDGNQVIIAGTLDSISNTTFTLDFYANSACDPSGYGEGEIYLGAEMVTTDGVGYTNFTASLPISVTVGYSLAATATDPDGNTSEFSLCQGVTALAPQLLSVDLDGTGSGVVSSDPAGITCPGDCDELYDYGTLVTLSASANADAIFSGWSGVCTGTGTCAVTLTETKSVTATFDLLPPGQYALSVSLAGDGNGTVSGPGIDCFSGAGADCTDIFTEGAVITLTASADADSVFSGWDGACSEASDCVITVAQNQSVTATFASIVSEFKIFLPLIFR